MICINLSLLSGLIYIFWQFIKINFGFVGEWHTEAILQRCSVKKMFLKISQNLQESTCTRVSFSWKFDLSYNFI